MSTDRDRTVIKHGDSHNPQPPHPCYPPRNIARSGYRHARYADIESSRSAKRDARRRGEVDPPHVVAEQD